jgi:nitrogen regulatory protein PII
MHQSFLQKGVKLITCVLPDDGSDKALMQALRQEKQVVTSSSIACRGIAVLQSAKSKGARLPVSTLVRRVDVAVAEDEADALFDYIYDKAGIGRKGGGVIFMGPPTSMTPFELPDGVPDEKAH